MFMIDNFMTKVYNPPPHYLTLSSLVLIVKEKQKEERMSEGRRRSRERKVHRTPRWNSCH